QTVAIAGAMTCFRLLGGVRTHAAGFFAAVPGNLAIALQEAEKMDINIRLITTSQALRLILMAAIIPTVLHGFAPNAAADTAMESDWPALLAVTAAGVAGALGAYVLRVPTALLLGVLVKQKRTLTYATAASSCSLGVRPSLVECDRSLLYSISMNSTISPWPVAGWHSAGHPSIRFSACRRSAPSANCPNNFLCGSSRPPYRAVRVLPGMHAQHNGCRDRSDASDRLSVVAGPRPCVMLA